jgi:diacylglycerol O-acyltransferase / wax synthase
VVVAEVKLNMTVMSYRDHMDFGIIADREQVDDVWSLMDTCRTALDEFEHAVFGQRRNGKASGGAARRAVTS